MSEMKATKFASRADTLAVFFKATFAKVKLGTDLVYAVEMSTPDGPSTDGGKLALQHILLVPPAGGVTLRVGSVNAASLEGELRSYAAVAADHRARFRGMDLGIDELSYDAFLEKARAFFTDRKIAITIADAPRAPAPAATPRTRTSPALPLTPAPHPTPAVRAAGSTPARSAAPARGAAPATASPSTTTTSAPGTTTPAATTPASSTALPARRGPTQSARAIATAPLPRSVVIGLAISAGLGLLLLALWMIQQLNG